MNICTTKMGLEQEEGEDRKAGGKQDKGRLVEDERVR